MTPTGSDPYSMAHSQPLLPRRRTYTFTSPSLSPYHHPPVTISTVSDLQLRRSATVPPGFGHFSGTSSLLPSGGEASSLTWRSLTSLPVLGSIYNANGSSSSSTTTTSTTKKRRRRARDITPSLLNCVGAKIHTRRAGQKSSQQQQQHVPLPEAAEEELPSDYTTTVQKAIASYNVESVVGSSGRSSPANMEIQSALAVSNGGWTTGNTTERSSVDSSCYSLDKRSPSTENLLWSASTFTSSDGLFSLTEFDRQAASTVNHHFEEFESMLFEGTRETGSTVNMECQEWLTQFPHLRVLGQQLMAPTDTGYNFVASNTSFTTPVRQSTSDTLDLSVADPHDLPASADGHGLALWGHKVKATDAPSESIVSAGVSSLNLPQNSNYSSSDFGFLHEEVFAEDGIYEDIIAVDYKDIYEDNMEHKKQITPRRRHVGYPPITPSACVKDTVLSGAFDKMWTETISWLQPLLKRYLLEMEGKKSSSTIEHMMIPQRPVRASSFVLTPREAPDAMLPLLQVSKMALRDRHNQSNLSSADMSDAAMLGESTHGAAAFMPVHQVATSRPSTMHHPQRRLSHTQHLDPLREPARVSTTDEGRTTHTSPQNALRVKQIVPGGSHRLSSPPAPMPGRLPPLESSSGAPSHRRQGHRASSAVDNKEGRKQQGVRERNSGSTEVSRPSTTRAFRSETPYGGHSLRSSAPMIHSIPARQFYVMGGNSGGLNVMGNGLYPSAETAQNILEDPESNSVDRHSQWMPSAPSFSFFKSRRTLRN